MAISKKLQKNRESGKELLNLIATIKKMQGVDRTVWSERVYQSPPKGNESMAYILDGQIER
jgi:hypothetical protein